VAYVGWVGVPEATGAAVVSVEEATAA
jgi:hypothetical protein